MVIHVASSGSHALLITNTMSFSSDLQSVARLHCTVPWPAWSSGAIMYSRSHSPSNAKPATFLSIDSQNFGGT